MESSFKLQFNEWVRRKQAFVFIIDFEQQQPVILTPKQAFDSGIYFKVGDFTNYNHSRYEKEKIKLQVTPVSLYDYQKSYDLVQKHIQNGDTYLLNLSMPTPIETKVSLRTIFDHAKAPYKLYFKEQFVSFSPETFVKITQNKIATFPMKGTIDADLPNAEKLLLDNQKEFYEHNTIVDLLRNDLAMVATGITIKRFRYIDKIKSSNKNLLQLSSEVTGNLPDNWQEQAAEIFEKLLPAGSISGAPKQKTVEIIQKAEKQQRGYYTGIFGYFDGQNFDTAVLIRYIEKKQNKLFYRSGGGITALSNLQEEYEELIHKIYVPTD